MPDTRLVTADELLAMGEGKRELIRGRVVDLSPGGGDHGRIGGNLFAAVWSFVKRERHGEVFNAETGFRLESDPDTVRAPDAAFVAKGRLEGLDESKFLPLAPDLVVEVVSPSDSFREVEEKAGMWLSFGARLVWVVEPDLRKAFVYSPDAPREEIAEDGRLTGGDVLPGLVIPLADCL